MSSILRAGVDVNHFEQVTEIESVYPRWKRGASPVGLTCKLPESAQRQSRRSSLHRSPVEQPVAALGAPPHFV